MTDADMVRARMRNQGLIGAALAGPAEVVRRLGAVQAQDYRGALWGIAQRTRGASESDVERAIAERAIARSWPMRGTLHFVAPEDLRWMLRHLAPRVIRGSAGRRRQLDLDGKTLARAGRILESALSGHRRLTRPEAYQVLRSARVSPDGQRGIHILAYLALHGLLCFGPRQGSQATFVLLDEWLPPSPEPDRGEALSGLARRYFTSHGPATIADFAWWSGLPLGEARDALTRARPALAELAVAGTAHFAARSARAPAARGAASAHLLPAYDEYTVAYRDRTAFLDPARAADAAGGIGSPVVVLGGRIAGTWRRRSGHSAAAITAALFTRPSPAAARAIRAAAARYGRFLGATTTVELASRA